MKMLGQRTLKVATGLLLAVVMATPAVSASAAAAKPDAWGTTTAIEDGGWNGIVFANGQFVAVGTKGTRRVMTSPDGKTWAVRTAAEMNLWNAVTYGNGTYVAVAGNGTNRVMTSPDGITWTARSAPTAVLASSWQSVTYANGLFVAVAQNGTYQVMTSPDGITWTGRNIPNFSVSTFLMSVTYGNGVFVVSTVCQAATDCILTSPDGITWTKRTGVAAGLWTGVTYGNGLFVAVNNDTSATGIVMSSPDGVTWTSRNILTSTAENPRVVIHDGSKFVAAGGNGKRVVTSTDGVTWAYPAADAKMAVNINVTSIAHGNGTYIGVGGLGTELMIYPTTLKSRETSFGLVPRKNGPGPLRVLRWAFSGGVILKDGVTAKMTVVPKSKAVCRMTAADNVVALKNGICYVRITLTPKTGKATVLPDLPLNAVFRSK